MVNVPLPPVLFPTIKLPLVTTPPVFTVKAPVPEFPTYRPLILVHVPLETVAVPIELALKPR